MLKIESAQLNTVAYDQFKTWLLQEWGDVEQLPESNKQTNLPMPLLAFENGELIGGMSFIYYKKPGAVTKGVWINTVYVAPEFRSKGVASLLISAAEESIINTIESELYVYTDKPNLYKQLGWQVISEKEDHYVLSKRLEQSDYVAL